MALEVHLPEQLTPTESSEDFTTAGVDGDLELASKELDSRV